MVFTFCLFGFIHGLSYLLPFSKHIFKGPVVLEVSFLHLPRVLSPKFTIQFNHCLLHWLFLQVNLITVVIYQKLFASALVTFFFFLSFLRSSKLLRSTPFPRTLLIQFISAYMGTLQDIAKQTYKLFLDEPFFRPLRSLTVKHPHPKRSALFAQTGYSLWRQPRVRPEED